MLELHHELPARFNLEWYRKQAKRLRDEHRAGEREAVERVEEVLGTKARHRFLLSDAQRVIAAEHGFRSWAEFTHGLESMATARRVGRVGSVGGTRDFEQRALELVEAVRQGEPDAIAR